MLPVAAAAQDTSQGQLQPVIVPSQSSVLNQNSVHLPTPPAVHGQDSVRSAGGTSCQSAVASGGPYVDMGVIGSDDPYDRGSTALYGRVVIPIGRRAKRVDCTRLYDLEVQRMRMELEVLRASVQMPTSVLPAAQAAGQVEQREVSATAPVERTEPAPTAPLIVEPAEGTKASSAPARATLPPAPAAVVAATLTEPPSPPSLRPARTEPQQVAAARSEAVDEGAGDRPPKHRCERVRQLRG